MGLKRRLDYQREFGPRGPSLEVCKVCGSLIDSNEKEDQLNDHYEGSSIWGMLRLGRNVRILGNRRERGRFGCGAFLARKMVVPKYLFRNMSLFSR